MAMIDRKELLAEVELFCGLSDSVLDELVALTSIKKLAAREELCHKGDEGGELYGILSGRLKALTSSEDGKEAIFLIMGPGEVFGEVALLDAGPRSVTIVSAEPSELLVLGRRDFLAFLRRHSDLALSLAQVLAGRVRRLSEAVEDAYFRSLPARLAKALLALSRSTSTETPDGLRIDMKLSQQDLGDLVGKTREAVNKQMRAWSEEGIVTMRAGVLLIHDVEQLESLASPLQF